MLRIYFLTSGDYHPQCTHFAPLLRLLTGLVNRLLASFALSLKDMANNYSSHSSLNRRQVAQALNIPPEMAARNGIPSRMSSADVAAIDADPPAWLAQSRANATGKRPIWVDLRCYLCDFLEVARPKKWWPDFTYVICDFHENDELPAAPAGWRRSEYDGVGSRFRGIVDSQDP